MTKRHQLIFGPGGNSESFYAQGHKRTVETFAWQKEQFGLKAFEYSFGRGINVSDAAAREIGQAARDSGVTLSVHAPYYINLASNMPETREKSIGYIRYSARLLRLMGGRRLVVHPGSPLKQPREEALARCVQALRQARAALLEDGNGEVALALETMGRPSQIGTLEEILDFVLLDASFLPCVDFAHLHAASGGALKQEKDFAAVLDRTEARLGYERARQMHIHFSKVEYGPKGELRHRLFSDEGFGPDFHPLIRLLVRRDYRAIIICESRGTMAEDAAVMQRAADEVLTG
ncbi:MAG: TIM barrel protein [Eubacteriales bacterium]|nr:TIM barrel protein [Eubacteriales bacterium]